MGTSVDASVKVYQLRESQGLMEDLRELGPGTVALYTLVGEDKYRVILTTPDFQKGYEYPIKAADLTHISCSGQSDVGQGRRTARGFCVYEAKPA